MFHFCLILTGNIIEPTVHKVTAKLHIKRTALPYRLFQIIRTCILVCIGELFFRADGLKNGFTMFRRIFTTFSLSTIKDRSIFTMGMDFKDYLVIIAAVFLQSAFFRKKEFTSVNLSLSATQLFSLHYFMHSFCSSSYLVHMELDIFLQIQSTRISKELIL